jgi:Mg-chelatase subunit ChlD
LTTIGATNLWSGLEKGVFVLKEDISDQGRHRSIILLTDGEPNILPPSSHE